MIRKPYCSRFSLHKFVHTIQHLKGKHVGAVGAQICEWKKYFGTVHCALCRWWYVGVKKVGGPFFIQWPRSLCITWWRLLPLLLGKQYLKGKHLGAVGAQIREQKNIFQDTVHCAGGGMLAWKKLVVPFLSNGLAASASRDGGCCHCCWENNLIEVSHGLPLMFPTTAAPKRY